MSSSDRRRVLTQLGGMLLLGGGLGGCFRPMLAKESPSTALIGRIRLPEFDDRFGYYLNDSLRDRLGRPRTEDFRLEVEARLEKSGLAITQDNAVTRVSLTATANWALYRVDGGTGGGTGGSKPALRGRAVSQSGYNSTASLFATRAAKLNIERRLARDLGERIARSLLAQAGSISAAAAS